jgi:PKD repeat protein
LKNKFVSLLLNTILIASLLLTIQAVSAAEVTLTLSDAELSTEFAYKWGPGTVTAIEDIPGLGVRFNFTGLGSSGTGVCDDFPVSQLAGGDPDNIGGYGDFRKYTQYRLVFTNLGPNPVSVNIDMNTGWTNVDPTRDTYWENGWTYLAVGESKVVTLDFSNAICWNAEDDPVPEWQYPGGTSGVIVRRLSEVSRIGFQVTGSGDASIVVSATIPKDTVVTLPDEELATQFAKETGPGTVDMVTDIPGYGVRFDFSGLSTSVGTVIGDSFPVSALAGGAWKDYGSGFAGPYDFSGYDRFSLLFINVGTKTVTVNLKINTGWTDSPWGSPEKDTFWQNGWTTIAPGESRIVTLDFWSAEVWNAMDDPVPEWRYPDGTTGVIVRRLDELSDIGFQILGDGEASIIVSGDLTLGLSDAELSSEFAYEWGPGTVTAITDIPGPGVRFDFSGLSTSVGTGVGDNFPVSALAGGAYKTYGVTQPFSTWGDFSGYNKYSMIFKNIGTTTIMVNLKINTGWTVPPPEYAKAWRDTFWQNEWTTILPGETKTITLNFSSAEVWNAADEEEYKTYPDGTAGVAVWRLDEVSNIGFQILGNDDASIIVSARPQPSQVYVDDDYTSSTPGWGYDHFATIQEGIDAVASGGTVKVYEGTYTEQLIINKSLTLIGDPGPKIVAPDTRNTFTIAESGATFDPIIFAYGSLSGPETISVTIEGFEIDGGNKAVSNYRYVAILLRNVKLGVISDNIIHSMYPPSGKGSGPQTFGILVYGNSEITISYNEIRDFSRGGIGIMGDAGPATDPSAVIDHNIVLGNGLEAETGWWAENGIQVGYGSTALIQENEVHNCTVNNPYWAATGILIVDTEEGVTVENSYVEGCDIGIGAVDFPSQYGPPWNYSILSNILITGNTLIGNSWQIDISNNATNITVTYNDIINATEDGIDIWSYFGDVYPTNVEIHYNNIEGSGSYGIWASDELEAAPVNATFNWWGDPSGPYHNTSWMYMGSPYGPHYGLGDNVTDYVLYYPWLSSPSGPPVEPPTASFVPSTNRARIDETITFDASSSMPNGGYITNYIWDFGDGNVTSTSDPMITHSYDAQGAYNVSLTVEDNEGLEDSTWQIVKVGPPALLKVEPTIIQAQMINKTFTINVTISDLWEDWNVVGVQFRLGYNSTLLEVINVTEGPFMKNFGDTFFTYVIEEPAYGYPAHVLIGIVLLPPWTDFPYGDGVLATITFKIIYQEKVLDPEATPPLTCSLMLFDVRDLFLVDYEQERIPCNLEHGLYEIYSNHIADVNWDYYVGIDDITYAAEHFGSDPETWPERWDPECDVTGDNYVGIDDIVLIASNFGWTPTYDP